MILTKRCIIFQVTESVDDSQAQLEDLYDQDDLLDEQEDNNNIDKEELQTKTMVGKSFFQITITIFLSRSWHGNCCNSPRSSGFSGYAL